ncbi:retinal pigment epithelial membrane protein-domain-containing protein [Tribonema minus]|uniref:Retinal pigment epithelial membrane protein-domain-containing protein n=1 Tax=Tribonema minus TaxID=303371 RepID=A0A835YN23_9STRA|nr:retinal pigment epithelial membrane protein-domain-containing protein [Tribonema minus]
MRLACVLPLLAAVGAFRLPRVLRSSGKCLSSSPASSQKERNSAQHMVLESASSQVLLPQVEQDVGEGLYNLEDWASSFNSQVREFDFTVPASDIEGTLPLNLVGTFFRSGPGRFERGGNQYGHFLDGDGYVMRATLKGGKVHFKSRFVQTEEYKVEAAKDAILFRSTFGTQPELSLLKKQFGVSWHPRNVFNLKLKNAANTNVVLRGGKLLALFEAGLPVALDPTTLETEGVDLLGGVLKEGLSTKVEGMSEALQERLGMGGCSHTAHPHFDPVRDVMVSWSWYALQKEKGLPQETVMEFFEWDKDMKMLSKSTHTAPGCAVNPHDFALTPNHYVFIENRGKVDLLPYLSGLAGAGQTLSTDPSRPMLLHVVPRPGPVDALSEVATEVSAAALTLSTDPSRPMLLHVVLRPGPVDALSDVASERPVLLHVVSRPRVADALSDVATEIDPAGSSAQLDGADATAQPGPVGATPGGQVGSLASGVKERAAFVVPMEPGFALHISHAFEEGGRLYVFSSAWGQRGITGEKLLGEWGGVAPDFSTGRIPMTYLYRTVVDLATGALVEHCVVDGMERTSTEHPHVDPRAETTPHARYLYATMSNDVGTSTPPQGICRLDLAGLEGSGSPNAGTRCARNGIQRWYPGSRQFTNEPIIIPKGQVDAGDEVGIESGSGDAPPSGVYVLTTVEDADSGRASLVILDGDDVSAGPLARVWLPYFPHQLHGTFTREVFTDAL